MFWPFRQVKPVNALYSRRSPLCFESLEHRLCPANVVFTVDDPGIAGDVNPGDGQALTADGTTTLVAAIQEANARFPITFDQFNIRLGGLELNLEGQILEITANVVTISDGDIKDGGFKLTGDNILVENIDFVTTQPINEVIRVEGRNNEINSVTIRPEVTSVINSSSNSPPIGIHFSTKCLGVNLLVLSNDIMIVVLLIP